MTDWSVLRRATTVLLAAATIPLGFTASSWAEAAAPAPQPAPTATADPGPAVIPAAEPGPKVRSVVPAADRAVAGFPPELESLEVTSPEHRSATEAFNSVAREVSTVRRRVRSTSNHLAALEREQVETVASVFSAHDDAAEAAALLEESQEGVDALAVATYQNALTRPDLPETWSGAERTERARRSHLERAVGGSIVAERRRQQTRRDDAVDRARRATERVEELAAVVPPARQAAAAAKVPLPALLTRLRSAQTAYTETRRTAMVGDTDLSLLAVAAYYRAAEEAPCRVDWRLLAGIGYVETHHGTYTSEGLDPTGRTLDWIIGIRLDGTEETLAIPDSDGGRLDGDLRFDRAVGPMQFIPTTWALSGVDGNGDTVADPHNLFDAAASAAAYLCRSGGGAAALGSYNRSEVYARAVLARRASYREIETEDPDPDLRPVDDVPEHRPTLPDLSEAARLAEFAERLAEACGAPQTPPENMVAGRTLEANPTPPVDDPGPVAGEVVGEVLGDVQLPVVDGDAPSATACDPVNQAPTAALSAAPAPPETRSG